MNRRIESASVGLPVSAVDQRRAVWRRRLIDVERGIMLGLRGDSMFSVYFFLSTIVLTAAGVLGIGIVEWAIVIIALTVVVAAELFHYVLRTLGEAIAHHLTDPVRRALRISQAAVCVCVVGSILSIGLIFGQRVWQILGP